MRSMLMLVLALWVVSESGGSRKQGILVLWVVGESRVYGKQGNLLSDLADRRKELGVLNSSNSDGSVSEKRTQHIAPLLPHGGTFVAKGIVPSNITDKLAISKHSLKLLADRDAALMLPHDKKMDRHVERMLTDRVSLDFQGHISQLDVVAGNAAAMQENAVRRQLDVISGNPADTQENAVRRQGVDSALLKYAGLSLSSNPQTGTIYDVALPPTLQGIQAQATLLDPATFRQAGLIFNEFSLPTNASFEPPSNFVLLVYRNISNFTVYTLPPQYEFGGPVVGIISSASNSTSLNPSVSASIALSPKTSINISLPVSSADAISNPLCAFFASNGSIFVSNLVALPNICVSSTLGDFALVFEASSIPSPTQSPPPPVATSSPSTNANGPPSSSTSSKGSKNWRLIVGATALALLGVAILVAVALVSGRLADRCKLFFTSRFTGNDEALQNSLIGNSKAPTAAVMRTRPALEIDMVHFTD